MLISGWAVLGAAAAVEIYGEAGFDAVVLDQQHGAIGHGVLHSCLTAATAANLPALVRVADNRPDLIGIALDAGAQGVICPMINSAADARRLVEAVKYPPLGKRSWGPYRARAMVDDDYFAIGNSWTIACAQIETAEALENIDEILAVEGLDMVLAGPNDLGLTLTGKPDIHAEAVIAALATVVGKAEAAGLMSAVFANDITYAKARAGEGWTLLAASTDGGLLGAAAKDAVSALR